MHHVGLFTDIIFNDHFIIFIFLSFLAVPKPLLLLAQAVGRMGVSAKLYGQCIK